MKFNCPVCQCELSEVAGNRLHPGDKNYGMTLFCSAMSCPAQEVMGHGNNVKDAYEVITQKFKKQ